MVKEKTGKQKKNVIKETAQKSLVLHNDDVNTFDHVIECLVEICNHEPEQAEQCAMIVHYKGKCIVKSGTYELLLPMTEALLNRGLTATIEEQ
jgi:ATP-dependent Clp protease adaptor protein ClpS